MAQTPNKQQTDNIINSAKTIADKAQEKVLDITSKFTAQKAQIDENISADKATAVTQELITKLATLPVVRVNREDFLRSTFGASPYIDDIIAHGPQYVFTVDSLRLKADEIIKNSTRKTSVASFAAGLPSNIALMAAAATADVVQYFGFALNMAQKIAYLFGEDNLFAAYTLTGDMMKVDGEAVPEEAQARMIVYLGVMLGVSGAGSLIVKTAHKAGNTIGKRVAAQALTKTSWYPLLKKVASSIGINITKQTVNKTISKAVPVMGGIVSGAITYATFNPMGGRLADVFVKMLNGEYDTDMDLNPEYAEKINSSNVMTSEDSSVIDADFTDT